MNSFLFSLTFPFLSPYIYNTKVTDLRWVVSSDESTILVFCTPIHCSTMRSVISWWGKVFLSLFITFRTNVRMSIIPLKMFVSICSPFGWSLDTSVEKKSDVVYIFAILCSTLACGSNQVFSSASFYFLSKSTKEDEES